MYDAQNSTEISDKILSQYDDQRCPDCNEEIPLTVQEGEECLNCGHVFWIERENDD